MDSPLDGDPTATVTRDRDRPYHLKFKPSEGYAIATWYLQERRIYRREAIIKSSDGWRRTLPMIVVYGIRLIPIVHSPETRSDGAEG